MQEMSAHKRPSNEGMQSVLVRRTSSVCVKCARLRRGEAVCVRGSSGKSRSGTAATQARLGGRMGVGTLRKARREVGLLRHRSQVQWEAGTTELKAAKRYISRPSSDPSESPPFQLPHPQAQPTTSLTALARKTVKGGCNEG